MEKAKKRLDRPSYWTWVVPLVAGHVVLALLVMGGAARSLSGVDTFIVVFLARTLAWRFRDIGWPVWIGPTILLGTMLVLPLAVIVMASNAGGDAMRWFSLVDLFTVPVNLMLLVVAGSVPGKPEQALEAAHVFD